MPGRLVEPTVQVRPQALLADGKTTDDWSGDASRLSTDSLYAVPREDWLSLASWNTPSKLTEFTFDAE